MEKKEIGKWLLSLLFVLVSTFAYADCCVDSCVVLSTNNPRKIRIGNRYVVEGLKFDDKEEIAWTNREEVILALYLSDIEKGENKVNRLYADEFSRKGWSSLYDTKHLKTKGFEINNDIEIDTIYYLWDTLIVPSPTIISDKIVAKAIAFIVNDSIVSTISRSKNGKEYIIPRKVIGNYSEPLYLDIIEMDLEKDWEYVVWRKLYIVPLPLKID